MKNLIISYSFLKKNITPIIIIVITMLFTLFSIISIYGKYTYLTYSKNILTNSGLENSVYFMPKLDNGDKEQASKLLNNIQVFNEVNSVIKIESSGTEYNNYPINILFYNNDFINRFKQNPKSGNWLTESNQIKNNDTVEAIIGGITWNNTNIGDIIKLTISGKIYNVKIIGILPEVTFIPQLGKSSSTFSANDFFVPNENFIYLNSNCFNNDEYKNIEKTMSRNYIIDIKNDVTDSKKSELLNYLSTYGQYLTYNQIIQNTNDKIDLEIRQNFPMPIFLLLISTVSMICVSAVAIQRFMHEQSIYYLIGSSKKRSIITIITSLSILFGIPIIINLISAIFIPDFLRSSRVEKVKYIIDTSCIIPVVFYFILIIGILTLMPILIYRKQSPLSFYRRNL